MASFLSALGIVIEPARVADWMTLVGVLALEIGSAMAGLLIAAGHDTNARRPEVGRAVVNVEIETTPIPSRIASATAVSVRAVEAVPGDGVRSTPDAPDTTADTGAISTAVMPIGEPGIVVAGQSAGQPDTAPDTSGQLSDAGRTVIDFLAARGGRISASQRALAADIGLPKSSLSDTLRELSGAGRVTIATGPRGTVLELARRTVPNTLAG